MLTSASSDSGRSIEDFREKLDALFLSLQKYPLAEEEFPATALHTLQDLGALHAALPTSYGGLGLSETYDGEKALLALLRGAGRLSLSLGRCIEGHINVVRLVTLYGTDGQKSDFSALLTKRTLAGIWVTDGSPPVILKQEKNGLVLHGIKGFVSAVREVSLALVTATTERNQSVMVLVPITDSSRIRPGPGHLTGMTASGTGAYDFSGIPISPDQIIGKSGDYERQPEFCAGAWRGSAVALGGMDRLVTLMRDELRQRRRTQSPHQQTRFGEALIAQQTAAMWVGNAVRLLHTTGATDGDIAATVNLTRIAAEQAALKLLILVQRSLGLSAFVRGKEVERVMRDLSTYLRQPAPDETLTEAASWFFEHEWKETCS